MRKSQELSEFDRGSIVGCHFCGKSVREIAVILQKPKSSKRVVKQNRKSSLVEISQGFQSSSGVSVSSRTVPRELKNLGFHGRAATLKPNITPQNRLQRCRDHRHWTVDMWKTVLWKDESRFTVWQSDGRVWVWRMPVERFFSDCIVSTVKFGGGSIMVWGCFSSFDLGPSVPVIGNIKSEMYVDILDNAALPSLWQYFGEGPFLFQQDNCAIHTSRLPQTWFDEMGVQKLDWRSQSPDLNPIEHLWDELEHILRSRPNQPSSLQTLASAVMDAWKEIPMVTYQKLVESLPKQELFPVIGEFVGVVGGQQLVFLERHKTCSIGFMSGKLAGHSTRTIPSSKRKSSTRLAPCGLQLSSIKMKSSPIAAA
ncbi:transposable element Tc1 transposase [Trichonephila clavipes]|nr:transposable element Tc1 transposase [Trichonephila clavipes]